MRSQGICTETLQVLNEVSQDLDWNLEDLDEISQDMG